MDADFVKRGDQINTAIIDFYENQYAFTYTAKTSGAGATIIKK